MKKIFSHIKAGTKSNVSKVGDAATTSPDEYSNQSWKPPINLETKPGRSLPSVKISASTSYPTLQLTLTNSTTSSNVNAYVSGRALDNNCVPVLIQSDGKSLYYPANPASICSPLTKDCAIPLGSPGSSRTITIPHIAGGRIWFALNGKLTFFVNPSPNGIPGLVEPSVTNITDPNYNIDWAFAEFTWNTDQLYANISFVDFISLPISLKLTTSTGEIKTISGLPKGGFDTIQSQLKAQSASENVAGWANLLIHDPSGKPLRILAPDKSLVLHPDDFDNYFEPYISTVLAQSTTTPPPTLTISGQTFPITTNPGAITIGPHTFAAPTTRDVLTCSTGPFATGADVQRNTMIPQLAAAFNRSTLLACARVPAPASAFYAHAVTNHYARIVHGVVAHGRGYAFPYDDVDPDGGADQSGFVNDCAPRDLTVVIGDR